MDGNVGDNVKLSEAVQRAKAVSNDDCKIFIHHVGIYDVGLTV